MIFSVVDTDMYFNCYDQVDDEDDAVDDDEEEDVVLPVDDDDEEVEGDLGGNTKVFLGVANDVSNRLKIGYLAYLLKSLWTAAA